MTTLVTKTNSNNQSNLKIAIIITAAGSSTRIGSGIKKEYLPFNNGTVLSNCAKTFLKSCQNIYTISDFIVTCPKEGTAVCQQILSSDKNLMELLSHFNTSDFIKIVEGGISRQESVFNALSSINNNPDIVLIHDGARPFVTERIILEGIKTAAEYGASVPGITPTDTQKQIDENGFIVSHLVRADLRAVQTPQCFKFNQLLEAHKKVMADSGKIEYTDDTEIWGKYCGAVKVYEGDSKNIKITYPGDLKALEE